MLRNRLLLLLSETGDWPDDELSAPLADEVFAFLCGRLRITGLAGTISIINC